MVCGHLCTRSFRASCSRTTNRRAKSGDHAMAMHRRTFLQSSGVALALPWLSVHSGWARGADVAAPTRRMVCICTPLGLHPPDFFPEKPGKDYEATTYLKVLENFRSDYTVVSGLSHAGMSPG